MKKSKIIIVTLLIVGILSCKNEVPQKEIIRDTVVVTKIDTVYIHDTIYTSKHYNSVGTVVIGGN